MEKDRKIKQLKEENRELLRRFDSSVKHIC